MNIKTLLKLAATASFLVSGAASATIVGSYHDLSITNTAHVSGATTDKICKFCHTPHNAVINVAPLWNRSTSTATYTMYDSSTMDMTVAAAPDPFSAACLSCHDGTIAIDQMVNMPYGYTSTAGTIGAGGLLSTDLSNDHPISVKYDTGLDNAFTAAVSSKVGTLPLFPGQTTTADQVECATCHNVHEFYPAPFLRMSNAGSALCLTCHIK